MKEKDKKEEPTGSVKIDPEVYTEVSDYCKQNGLKITFFTTEAVREKLRAIKEQTN